MTADFLTAGLPAAALTAEVVGERMRTVLRRVPTSVAVVAGIDAEGRPAGLTVGTFTSVSLDPPLVAFCPASTSSSWPRIRPARRFTISLLSADQQDVCAVFSTKHPDKFAGLQWHPAPNSSPRLPGAIAWLDCDLEIEHVAGDHTLVIGRVTHLEAGPSTAPMVFLEGRYRGVG